MKRAHFRGDLSVSDRLATAAFVCGKHAFITHLFLIDHCRKLSFRDPGLPTEVPAEDWSAPVRLLDRMVATLRGRAPARAAPCWSVQTRAAEVTNDAG